MRFPLLGAALLTTAAVLALLGPALAPYDPRLVSGMPLLPPDRAHLLGTNDIGQDVLSEWLGAARASLLTAVLITALSTALSWSVGILAGVWRPAEGTLMALADLLLAIPSLLLYLLVVTLIGPSQGHVVLTLGLLSWPAFARLVRAQVIAIRGRTHIESARALGATAFHIARVHVLPGTLGLLPAKIVLTVRFAIFAEATLAFLGLGDPSRQSWGAMLGWAFGYPLLFTGRAWLWWALPPALSIVLIVLATTWLATGLEAATEHRTA